MEYWNDGIMEMRPAVSVSMNLHNSMRYIDETIQSLLAQTWSDFEAILVDDGSTDGTFDHTAGHFPFKVSPLLKRNDSIGG
jgi:cellulose synthase/poly-beta-1,6-N-acetylglucosamine synthase-like glycosyltransferase